MPIPRPKSGEKQSDFIERCVVKIIGEHGRDEALAICYKEYKDNN